MSMFFPVLSRFRRISSDCRRDASIESAHDPSGDPITSDGRSWPAAALRGVSMGPIKFAVAIALGLAACAAASPTQDHAEGVRVQTLARHDTNVHLVTVGDKTIMIDAGVTGDAHALAQDVRNLGIDPASLRAVLLTHGHADHAGAAAYFQRQFGVPVIAGAGDAVALARGSNDPLCPVGLIARFRLRSDQAARFTPVTPDIVVSEPVDLASMTGIPGRIIPTPGHTPGSLVVTIGDAAFVGDLFRGDAIFRAHARTHFYMCDRDDNRADIGQLLAQVAEAGTFYPGHFGPIPRKRVQRLSQNRQGGRR